jgi:hypothetical protein
VFAPATGTSLTPTLNLNGLGALPINGRNGATLTEPLFASHYYTLRCMGGTSWRIISGGPAVLPELPLTEISGSGGTANAQTFTVPWWANAGFASGNQIIYRPNFTNTASEPTIGGVTVKDALGNAIAAGDLVLNGFYLMRYVATGPQWRIITTASTLSQITALATTAANTQITARDAWIGWSEEQRRRRLKFLINTSRYVILTKERYPNLATCFGGQRLVQIGYVESERPSQSR